MISARVAGRGWRTGRLTERMETRFKRRFDACIDSTSGDGDEEETRSVARGFSGKIRSFAPDGVGSVGADFVPAGEVTGAIRVELCCFGPFDTEMQAKLAALMAASLACIAGMQLSKRVASSAF